MKNIISLTAENVKRLRAVRIEPDGKSMIVVGGKNGAGKTSVLDCIEMALGGMGSAPPKPVRAGSKKAQIILELDGLTVRRTISSKGNTTLEVKDSDGEKMASPQAVLDKLVGALSFDPLSFARMDAKRQLICLRDLVGLDLSDLDSKRKGIYDDRRDAGREVARLEGAAKSIIRHDDAPLEDVSVSELLQELESRRSHNAQGTELSDEVDRMKRVVHASKSNVEDHGEDIQAAREKVKKLEGEYQDLLSSQSADVGDLATTIAELDAFKYQDAQEIAERIDNAEAENKKFRDNESAKKADLELKKAQQMQEDLTSDINKIDEQKESRLAEASFPVDGLGFDEDGVTMAGLPFEQASDAERLRVSVAMGLAVNPELKVILIRDGSLLDEESLEVVAKMAEEADAQVWVERVGKGKEVTVLIEDGEVKE